MRVNLIDVLRDRAAAQPEAPAFTFLEAGEQEGATFTWAQLDAGSRAIASSIQARAFSGDRVLVLLPPGIEFVPAFFGVLYAGCIAIPAYPPSSGRPDRASERLRAVIADAGVSLVLSSSAVLNRPALAAVLPELSTMPAIAIDAIDDDASDTWRIPACDGETLALLQYTSGSTASPRGVMVSHGNLLANLAQSATTARLDEATISVSWLPVNHDMGLIDGVLQPVFNGHHAYLMAPAAFLQRPSRWLQAISRYGATHSGAPNFAYDLCVKRVPDDERDALDLCAWRVAYNGSEPVRRSTMEAFHQRFASCGFRWDAFRPAYGLAESTLLVTSIPDGDAPTFLEVEPGRSLVSCGVVNCHPRIRIVDPARHTAVRDGAVGEIWVAGASVARGYWNRPRESAATFRATLDGSADGPFLRTGDLGCIVNGRLFVTGRIKDIVIVRGVKHYPQDLEAVAEHAHPAIRAGCCAAFGFEEDGEERVAIVAEIDPRRQPGEAGLADVPAAIRAAVSATHQITLAAVAIVPAGTLPKTTSGKLQRFLCREGFLAGDYERIQERPASLAS